MKPHSTEVAGYHDNPSGDLRFFNNLFAEDGDLSAFNQTRLPMQLAGNVFVERAKPCSQEVEPLVKPEFDADIQCIEKSEGLFLSITLDVAWAATRRRDLVTSETLGSAIIPSLPFQRADGSAIRIDRDFRGKQRNTENPFPWAFRASRGRKAYRACGIFRVDRPGLSVQNRSRIAICINRGGMALTAWPKVPLDMLPSTVAGPKNCA